MTRRCVLFARMTVITLTVLLVLSGARVSDNDDENLPDELRSCDVDQRGRDIHRERGEDREQRDRDVHREGRPECAALSSFLREVHPSKDQIRCFIIAFRRFADDLVGHRFTVLSDKPDAGGPGICQIDFFRYRSNTLFRARVDLTRRRIISTQIVHNTNPDASPVEVAEARAMAEVGALADRIATTPGLVVTALLGQGLLPSAGGSSLCVTDRCIELRYYGSAGTGTAAAAEPLGASFTFVNQQEVAVAVVDLTRQIVLHSEVFP
jgi:hypothetical protein